MNAILSTAIALTTLTSLLLVLRYRNVRIEGSTPMPRVTFLAVLFTSGLDVGLLMFPMVDFEIFANEADYAFANPLALEFGFWGFLVWGFYFLTTFYFCVVEPRLQLFEIPLIKLINNLTIIGTCAFTGYLFLHYLPGYIEGIPDAVRYSLVAGTVLVAVISSTQIRFVKALSLASSGLFFALIAGSFWASGMGVSGFAGTVGELGDYFGQLPRFVFPINDYHAFYLFWWFAWSIMIGQFVSRFVSGFTAWQLLLLLLVVPSIPIALWFSVLYWYFAQRHFDRRSDELGHDGCGRFVRRELARLAYTAIHSEHRADCGEARHRALRRPQLGRPVCAGAGLPVHAFQDRVGGAGCRRDLRGHLLADLYAPRCAAISLRLNYPAQ